MLSEIYKVFKRSTGISTDTRTLKPGQLFFALKGDRFNGNLHAGSAIAQGAIAAVVDEDTEALGQTFKVNDALQTLQSLATYHRNQFQIPVLAIGGSNGKTTTKELLRSVLQKKYQITVTHGNLNNHIGVPLTMLRINEQTEIALIEIGTNHPGEIKALCEILNPTHGLITNIGKEHLEGFGNIEGVALEESALFDFLKNHQGQAFVNCDDEWLWNMSRRLQNKVLYGVAGPNKEVEAYRIHPINGYPTLSYRLPNHENIGTSSLFGTFNFENIAAAAAVGNHFKVDNNSILEAIAEYEPDNMRSQVRKSNGRTLVLDCYNANPSSMEKALLDFAGMPGKKLAIIGDMLELGNSAAEEHASIAKLCSGLNIEQTISVGSSFLNTQQASLLSFSDTQSAGEWLSSNHAKFDTFLLKGSRGIGLERLLEVIDGKKES